jgi:hypothetical protein
VSASTKPFSIVAFQDGSVAVVHSVPRAARSGSHRDLLRSRTRPRLRRQRKQPLCRARKCADRGPDTTACRTNCANTGTERAPKRGAQGAPRKDGCEHAGGSEGRRPRRSRERAARIIAFDPAIPGEEGPHQKHPSRLRTSTPRLSSAARRASAFNRRVGRAQRGWAITIASVSTSNRRTASRPFPMLPSC